MLSSLLASSSNVVILSRNKVPASTITGYSFLNLYSPCLSILSVYNLCSGLLYILPDILYITAE